MFCPKWFVRLTAALAVILLLACAIAAQSGQPLSAHRQRYVIVEVFLQNDEPRHQLFLKAVEEFSYGRQGVLLHVHDLSGEQRNSAEQRLAKIQSALKLKDAPLPLVYSCGSVIAGTPDSLDLSLKFEELLRIDAYVRAGCSRCKNAELYLNSLQRTYPAFEIRFRDLVSDGEARRALNRLVTHYRKPAASVPVIHLCNQLIVGFDSAKTTGQRIEKVLNYWTVPKLTPRVSLRSSAGNLRAVMSVWVPLQITLAARTPLNEAGSDRSESEGAQGSSADLPELPLPPEELSESAEAQCEQFPLPLDVPYGENPDAIDLPWLGQITVSELGMPLFTIVVGLVDGFNPCAMWVLLFLLSILVNLRDRMRILTVAGTFVFISGLAYFAFMAAWLNVFLLIGLLRPIQIALGVTAIAVGSVHIKDFFAFKKGISLSIPESVKPSIYQRTRRIVNAENLWGALAAASVLAVFVNIVELLCTAGLPALYTEVLTLQGWPAWKNYAYLLLYNVAYMFDDGLMVACVVVTLSKTKMQERHGQWLKLISGIAIAALGMIMLVRPDWLS
jgi:hypothetical protein